MKLDRYQSVVLRRDLPEHRLRQGDVVMLLDAVPHPGTGEEGCILEVFNALGESIAVIAVPLSMVEPLRPNQILTVRSI